MRGISAPGHLIVSRRTDSVARRLRSRSSSTPLYRRVFELYVGLPTLSSVDAIPPRCWSDGGSRSCTAPALASTRSQPSGAWSHNGAVALGQIADRASPQEWHAPMSPCPEGRSEPANHHILHGLQGAALPSKRVARYSSSASGCALGTTSSACSGTRISRGVPRPAAPAASR